MRVPEVAVPRVPAPDRREFLKTCLMAAASIGLSSSAATRIAEAVARGVRPSVIWLHFQECTGCTETLLRSSHPSLARLLLELISLDYHETLMAGAGRQAEHSLHQAMDRHGNSFVCVVEGAIPTRHDGAFCRIAGRTARDLLEEVAGRAGAVIAIGSCASWGGIPSADPNPTGATGVPQLLGERPVVTLPGCPPNPYNLLGTVLQYAVLGTLPALDETGRPRFAYGRTIHDDCPRRAHFDAGRFARQYGDEGHRNGYCLYELGCKGPQTHAGCATRSFGDVPGAWPVGVGHPCVGCTEQAIAFRVPLHATVAIDRPTPPEAAPPVHTEREGVSPLAAGVAGFLLGAAAGAGYLASRKLGGNAGAESSPKAARRPPGPEKRDESPGADRAPSSAEAAAPEAATSSGDGSQRKDED